MAHGVAQRDQGLIAAVQTHRHMAGRVTRCVDERDTRNNFVALTCQRPLDTFCGKAVDRASDELEHFRADLICEAVLAPVGMLCLADDIFGFGEERLIKVVADAPDVIGVRVGDHDMGDVTWSEACGFQIADKAACGFEPAVARADIYEDFGLGCLDQEVICMAVALFWREIMRGEKGLHLFAGGVDPKARCGHGKEAIGEHAELHIAHGKAENTAIACGGCAKRRGGRLRQRGGQRKGRHRCGNFEDVTAGWFDQAHGRLPCLILGESRAARAKRNAFRECVRCFRRGERRSARACRFRG